MKTCKTYEAKIYIAGDLHTIEQACRQFCLRGACVTVTPTTFVYTGGAETGAIVGFMAYPRFPKTNEDLRSLAVELANQLMQHAAQRSCSVVTPTGTHYLENPEIVIPR